MAHCPGVAIEDRLAKSLAKLSWRWRCAVFVRWMGPTTPVCLGVAAGLWIVWHRLGTPGGPIAFVYVGLALALAVSLGAAAASGRSRIRLAKMADDAAGLADLLSSAVQLTTAGTAQQAVQRRAAAQVATVEHAAVIPVPFPRAILWGLVPIAALAALPWGLRTEPRKPDPPFASEPAANEPLLALAAERIERLAAAAEFTKPRATRAEKIVKALRDPARTPEQKFNALVAATKQARDDLKALQAQAAEPAAAESDRLSASHTPRAPARKLLDELEQAIENQQMARGNRFRVEGGQVHWEHEEGGRDEQNRDRLLRFTRKGSNPLDATPTGDPVPNRLGKKTELHGTSLPRVVESSGGSATGRPFRILIDKDDSRSLLRYKKYAGRFASRAEAQTRRSNVPGKYKRLVKDYFDFLDREIFNRIEGSNRGDD